MNVDNKYAIFKNLMLFTLVIFVIFLVFKLQTVVLLFFSAYIIASAINPVVEFFAKKMQRAFAVAITLLIFAVITGVIFLPLTNLLIAQTLALLKNAPVYWEKITEISTNTGSLTNFAHSTGISKWMALAEKIGVLPEISKIMEVASTVGQNILSGSIDFTRNFFTSIMLLFTMIILCLFMLADKNYLRDKALSYFPKDMREKAARILKIISQKVGGYVISQFAVVTAIFILLGLGLYLVKIDFALVLALVGAFLELIPVIGPAITGILIVLAALAQKPILALFGLAVYVLVQWVVDNLIRPVIVAKFLKMHPLTFIFSLLAGAYLYGIVGLLLAPPFIAAICVIIDELYLNKVK